MFDKFPNLESQFLEALKHGLPPYPKGVRASTPIDATPYLIEFPTFMQAEWSPKRKKLAGELAAMIRELASKEIMVHVVLVGGSFISLDKEPKDLDCVLFYSRDDGLGNDLASAETSRMPAIDARLVPIEVEPALVIKIAIFFALLYSRTRESAEISRAPLLLRVDEVDRKGG